MVFREETCHKEGRRKLETRDKARDFDRSRPSDFEVYISYRLSSQLSTANRILSLDFLLFAPIIDQRREINEIR